MGTYDTRSGAPISPDMNDSVTDLQEAVLGLLEDAGIDTATNDQIIKLIADAEAALERGPIPMTAPTGIDLEAINKRHEEMERIIADQGNALHLTTWIRTRNETHTDRAALRAFAASQAEQIAGMRKALEPFAKEAESRESLPDHYELWIRCDGFDGMGMLDCTLADLRAAKAAYDATQTGD